ncbi:hypothetical protein KZY75_03600 [Prevotella salivae]|uniref:Uncharacterized protein n=1 Tax=Segatella salivae TaxID=228604 RepID=A0AAW4NNV7_9BACT|nr:hypothetical protein [Segatella salivae]MBW4865122.1 hypothetical protein [Segatella salivae]MBW4907039.1 hypothetical protein [Segatella salivae]MBW4909129.1 hypothetical protein [Segatella salivae]
MIQINKRLATMLGIISPIAPWQTRLNQTWFNSNAMRLSALLAILGIDICERREVVVR